MSLWRRRQETWLDDIAYLMWQLAAIKLGIPADEFLLRQRPFFLRSDYSRRTAAVAYVARKIYHLNMYDQLLMYGHRFEPGWFDLVSEYNLVEYQSHLV